MPNPGHAITRACLAGAATITLLWMLVTLYQLTGTGVFHADYYYVPLREYVPEAKRDAMENRVIDLYNASQRRASIIRMGVLGILLVLLLSARWALASPAEATRRNQAMQRSGKKPVENG